MLPKSIPALPDVPPTTPIKASYPTPVASVNCAIVPADGVGGVPPITAFSLVEGLLVPIPKRPLVLSQK